jgi:hypothetical protein
MGAILLPMGAILIPMTRFSFRWGVILIPMTPFSFRWMGSAEKARAKAKAIISRFALRASLQAFGRAVAPSAWHFIGTRERVPFPGTPFPLPK